MGERMRFTIRMNSISLLVVLLTVAAGSAEGQVARKPKLFFVSTSATTTTLQTLSVCYVSSTSITTCSGRKKRAINMDGKLSPKDAAPFELEPSQREQDASAPPPPSPPHTRSAVPSALLLVPTFVDRPIT